MSPNFQYIPGTIRIPGVWNEFAPPTQVGTPNLRTVIVGQTINALAAVPQLAVSLTQVQTLCGRGSMLALMMDDYTQNDPTGEVWILPLADDGSAVEASGTIGFTGTTTADGVLSLYIGGQLVSVAIPSGSTNAATQALVTAAINAIADLPVTADVGGDSHTTALTAKNAGLCGNDIDIRINYLGAPNGEATPAGLTVAITAMAGGLTDPSLDAPLATLGKLPFEMIVHPYSTAAGIAKFTALMNEATGRWSWLQMLYGHVVTSRRGSNADKATAVSALVAEVGAAAINDAHQTVFGFYGKPKTAWQDAAAHAGQIIVRVRAHNAPPPMRGRVIQGALAPAPADQFTVSDEQTLLSNGVALDYFTADGSTRILRTITTYQQDASGDADVSYLDAETMFAAATFIRTYLTKLGAKYRNVKIADNGTNFGRNGGAPVVTPNAINAECVAIYKGLIRRGVVDNLDRFKAGLQVARNKDDPSRVDIFLPPRIVPGLQVLASQTQVHQG